MRGSRKEATTPAVSSSDALSDTRRVKLRWLCARTLAIDSRSSPDLLRVGMPTVTSTLAASEVAFGFTWRGMPPTLYPGWAKAALHWLAASASDPPDDAGSALSTRR